MSDSAWGVLECTTPKYPSIPLYDTTSLFGRNNTSMKIRNLTISSRHFIIQVKQEGNEKKYICIDTSTNGTYINNEIMGKRMATKEIKLYDEISMLDPQKDEGSISYIFIPFEEQKKEKIEGGPQNKYDIGRYLGSGNFARVREVIEKDNKQKYAIKIIDRQKMKEIGENEKVVLNEYSIMKKLHHINIIQLHDVFLTQEYFYLVFELVDGGDLFKLTLNKGCLNEKECRIVIKQIFYGIKYLHQNKIIHRDIKLENILLTSNGIIKITDFGLSKDTKKSIAETICGTPMYVSPELLSGQNYNEKTDIWSAGVVLYTIACGFQPFRSENETEDGKGGNRELFDLILNGYYQFISPYWDNISLELKDLISHMLIVNPKQRYDIEECLSHPFITSTKRDNLDLNQPAIKREYDR
ncbi:hypothetical protein ENUP19_0052G0061 [Entamoeba nuttalli]|uniref:Protein kinase n=2 Tax=Entamoeba nuttalli TaxID=412467 RepID=A0ABQ0DC04_9EUKA